MKLNMKVLRNIYHNLRGNLNSEEYWNNKLDRLQSWKKRNSIYEKITAYIPKESKSVLDIGCSLGDGCKVIKDIRKDLTVAGCDFSQVGIEEAKKKYSDIEFFYLDVMKDDIPDGYDTHLLVSILEHLNEYHAVIQKCLRKCNTLIVSCPYNETVSFLGFHPSEHLHSFKEKTLERYDAKAHVDGKRILYVMRGEK